MFLNGELLQWKNELDKNKKEDTVGKVLMRMRDVQWNLIKTRASINFREIKIMEVS